MNERTVILDKPAKTANGKYIIDGWKRTEETIDGYALIRSIGWCEYSNKLSAILIPNVGWMTY